MKSCSFMLCVAAMLSAAAVMAAPSESTDNVDVAKEASLSQKIKLRIAVSLPDHLAVTSVSVSQTMAERTVDDAPGAIAVHWTRAPRAGRQSVKIAVRLDDGQVRSGWSMVEIRKLVPVLVALKALAAGQQIKPGDVGLQRLPVDRGEGWQFTPSAIIGSSILRQVSKGEVISAQTVELPAPLSRGTSVSVVLRRGRVTIKTSGTIESEVRLGQLASVRLAGNHALVRGRLLDRETVLIDGENK